MKSKVDVDKIMSWGPCGMNSDGYTREKVEKLFKQICGKKKYGTLADALNAPIPPDDIFWLSDSKGTEEQVNTRRMSDEMQVMEKQYDDEDEAMLVRLMRIRQSLWT